MSPVANTSVREFTMSPTNTRAERPVGRSFARGATCELGHDVEMARMPRILLHEVEQHSLEGCRWLAIPAGAGTSDIGQSVGLDDSVTASGLVAESHE